jgi:hypothetical protein
MRCEPVHVHAGASAESRHDKANMFSRASTHYRGRAVSALSVSQDVRDTVTPSCGLARIYAVKPLRMRMKLCVLASTALSCVW